MTNPKQPKPDQSGDASPSQADIERRNAEAAAQPAPGESPASDARHPDTDADKDPADYGFRPIEVVDVDETGPGSVEPVRVESVSGGTFAERAKSRSGGDKAVGSQQAENK